MNDRKRGGLSDVTVWVWLVVLLIAEVVAILLPVAKVAILLVVFGAAVWKAALVARDYMHLKSEHILIYAIAGVPVLLVLGFALMLIPDILLHH